MKHRLGLRKDSREMQTEDKPQRAREDGETEVRKENSPRETGNTNTLGESGRGWRVPRLMSLQGKPGSKGSKGPSRQKAELRPFPEVQPLPKRKLQPHNAQPHRKPRDGKNTKLLLGRE